MLVALAACGGDKGGNKSSKHSLAGNYLAVGMVTEDGYETSYAEMLEVGSVEGTYLKINDDGTGKLVLGGEVEADITKIDTDKKEFTFDDGSSVTYAKDGDKITVTIEDTGFKVIFALEGSDTYNEIVNAAGDYYSYETYFSDEDIEAFEGDWFGIAECYDCTGEFEANEGLQMEILARFAFDEDGYCTPYIALAVDEESNINDLVAMPSYSENNVMDIVGTLMGIYFDDASFLELEDDGSMSIYIGIDETEADGMEIMASLRRIDDQDNWSDSNYPLPSQEYIDYYKGMTLEEIAESCYLDTSKMPYATSMAGTGTSAIVEYGKSSPSATGDTTLDAMQDMFVDLYAVRNDTYHKIKYEQVRDTLGCDGVPWQLDEHTWSDTLHSYKWQDGDDFLYITFKIDEGEEWYNSSTYSKEVMAKQKK